MPTASDSVIIDLGNQNGFTITHSSSASDAVYSLSSQNALVISGGSLSVLATSVVNGQVTISGGVFTDNGDLQVTTLSILNGSTFTGNGTSTAAALDWEGVIGGTGSLTVSGPATLNGGGYLDTATLVLEGSTSWVYERYWLSNGATIDNRGSLTVLSSGFGIAWSNGAPARFINEGTLIKNSPSFSMVSTDFSNSGQVVLEQGTLSVGVATGNVDTSSGTFTAAAGTTLDFSGSQVLLAQPDPSQDTVNADSVTFGVIPANVGHGANGTVTIQGRYSAATSTTVDSKAVFQGPVDNVGNSLTVDSTGSADFTALAGVDRTLGSLTVDGTLASNDSYSATTLSILNGGTFTSSGVSTAAAFDWGGTLAGTGSLTVSGPATLNGGGYLDTATLVLEGSTSWVYERYWLSDGATIDNRGTFSILSSGFGIAWSNGAPARFINEGTLVKNSPSFSMISTDFSNSGQVVLEQGTLSLGVKTGNVDTSSGTFTAAAGTTLDFSGSQVLLAQPDPAQYTINADAVTFGDIPTNVGHDANGTVTVQGRYSAATSTTMESNAVFQGPVDSVGSLTVGTGASANFSPSSQLQTLTLAALDIEHGTLSGSDDFVVMGVFSWDGGTLSGSAGSSLTAQGGIAIGSDFLSTVDGYTLINSGIATAAGANLLVTGGGAVDNLPGATFGAAASGNSITLNDGTLSGSGIVNADVDNVGEVAPGSPVGVLDLQGKYSQAASGTFQILLGGLDSGVDTSELEVNGSMLLDGTLQVGLAQGFVPHLGDTFTIIKNDGPTSASGAFANVLAPAGYGFQVSYAGGADQQDITLTVTQVPATVTTISSSVNPSLLSQPVTFSATVSAVSPNLPTPTGSVDFVDTTTNTDLGSAALSNGSASLTTSFLGVGSHDIQAIYAGEGIFQGSSGTLTQQVAYAFSGFLPPVSQNMAFALNRTIPIKFQLADVSGTAITSLGAVTSLQIQALDANGDPTGAPFSPTAAGGTALRNDGSEYIFNWQTKGLTAGSYEILLTLADGSTKTHTLQLVSSNASSGLVVDGSSGSGSTAGALLGGDVSLYVDNSNSDLTPDELARINDAVAAVDATIAPYGVTITEVGDPTLADATLTMDSTSPVGGYADGVLGCTTDSGQVTIIAGWNFYTGSDATQIGSAQYDFQTVVTHELGHVLGLRHSADAASVMYATLDLGVAKRTLVAADLNVPDADGGPCGLHAQPHPFAPVASVDALFATLAHWPQNSVPTGSATMAEAPERPGLALPSARWSTTAVPLWETAGDAATDLDLLFAQLGQDSSQAGWGLSDWLPAWGSASRANA